MPGQPDWKPVKRIVKPQNVRRKLEVDRRCRNCGDAATDGHHILFKSQGGDDIPDNVMPLCHDCHMDFHDGRLTQLRLRGEELLYLRRKLGTQRAGDDYARRRYGWS